MAEVEYYFDSYDAAADKWGDPEKMVDNNLSSWAYTNALNMTETLLTNTCPGTNLGTITKVEIRAYTYVSGTLGSKIELRPIFGAVSNGDDHQIGPGFAGAWSSYFDITSDTNAPGVWGWSDVQALDCRVLADTASGTVHVSKVEIRVTYNPGGGGGAILLLTKVSK